MLSNSAHQTEQVKCTSCEAARNVRLAEALLAKEDFLLQVHAFLQSGYASGEVGNKAWEIYHLLKAQCRKNTENK